MKIRTGFISNSSSTSFIITNTTDKVLTLVDFVEENPKLIEAFKHQYSGFDDWTQDHMIENAKLRNTIFKPGINYVTFGDEDGDVVGHVFDYILRYGGKSKSFKWKFHEYRR